MWKRGQLQKLCRMYSHVYSPPVFSWLPCCAECISFLGNQSSSIWYLITRVAHTVQFCLYGRAVWNSMFRCSSDKEQLSFWTRNNCSAVTSARNKYHHHHEFLSYLPCCSYGGLTPFRWEICAPISCELKPSCGEIVLGWDFKCRFLFSSFLWWMAMPKHQGLPVLVHLLTT